MSFYKYGRNFYILKGELFSLMAMQGAEILHQLKVV